MSTESVKKLEATFKWLNVTQFVGALNDNIFKLLTLFFILGLEGQGLGAEASASLSAKVGAILAVVFVVPFLMFSHAGGVLADHFAKQKVVIACKVGEIVIMLGGCLAFSLNNMLLAYVMLFLMAVQSAIFGPSKYGLIPELVRRERLSHANSLIVMCTFLAIILGFPTAAYLSDRVEGAYVMAGLTCVAIASAGLFSAINIGKTPGAGRKLAFTPLFFLSIFKTLRSTAKDRPLFLAILGSAYFMVLGSFVQLAIIPYGMEHLRWEKEAASMLFLMVAIGIATGSIIAGKISGRNIEFGLVPIGVFGMAIASACMFPISSLMVPDGDILPLEIPGLMIALFCLGCSAGIFLVPLNSFIQYRVEPSRLGEVLAANAFLGFLGAAFGAALLFVLNTLEFSPGKSFYVMGCVTAVLAVISIRALPDFLVRFLGLIVTKVVYRIRVRGIEHLPVEGGALLTPNHVTWMDALFLNATTRRRIRFVMDRSIYENPWLRPVLDLMRVIPISSADNPKDLVRALNAARQAITDGYLVCVFPEGRLTRNGNVGRFQSGYVQILKGVDCPVIPVHISGAWGSIFSYFHGSLLPRRFTRIPYPVTVSYGVSRPSSIDPSSLRASVVELGAEAALDSDRSGSSLGRRFMRTARKNWSGRFMIDSTGKSYTFGNALLAGLALGDVLAERDPGDRMVGVLFPASAAGSLVNLGLILKGRVPVNLNFTASSENIAHAIRECGIKTVVSSRKFLDSMDGLNAPEGTLCLEDLVRDIPLTKKLGLICRARLMPTSWVVPRLENRGDSIATVIFSSGSTGTPKGVMLSHHNVLQNLSSVSDAFRFSAKDNLCSALPLFHSFGFTATLWLPAICGFSVCYHSNPLDGKTIARLVREHQSTVLMSTPTFLLAYIRRATAEDFQSLRAVVVGAEKLKPSLADSFESRFGVRPLEGYGATELSPVVSFNLPDVEVDGVQQIGRRDGTIGQPLPGIAVRINDTESGEPLSVGEEGVLFVKGANVMLGYLGQPEKTAEAIQDGWYNTGDVARLDEEGFITITDRLARFSKIGGEMVSHVAVENIYLHGVTAGELVLMVVSVPDERKGERLVVLHTPAAGEKEQLIETMSAADVPNLWKPRKEAYLAIDAIPVLGTGKTDLKGARAIALDLLGVNA